MEDAAIKQTVRLTILVLFALTCGPIHRVLAFEEPKGFRDIEFGESEKTAWPKLKAMHVPQSSAFFEPVILPACVDVREPQMPQRSCRIRNIMIGQTLITVVIIIFRDDRFVEAILGFDSLHFADLEAAFIQRYSSPTKIVEMPAGNLAGFQTTNRVLEWIGENVQVTLGQYAGTIKEGFANISRKSEVTLQEELRQRQRKAGAKD